MTDLIRLRDDELELLIEQSRDGTAWGDADGIHMGRQRRKQIGDDLPGYVQPLWGVQYLDHRQIERDREEELEASLAPINPVGSTHTERMAKAKVALRETRQERKAYLKRRERREVAELFARQDAERRAREHEEWVAEIEQRQRARRRARERAAAQAEERAARQAEYETRGLEADRRDALLKWTNANLGRMWAPTSVIEHESGVYDDVPQPRVVIVSDLIALYREGYLERAEVPPPANGWLWKAIRY